ncbi:MAG: energy-coupling factor transporter transmembrane protein EcfT [Treponema sp.]|jgi:energy-coupling factor transport system permease protein|nr:energy-coupling factor transporter transmembrane protein EcfT [Treponema sp.]
MTSRRTLSYIEGNSPVHALAGAVKLAAFLLWSVLVMVSFETRILAGLAVLGLVLFRLSRISLADAAVILKMMAVFLVLNLAAIYLFAPEQGVAIYHTRHVLVEGTGRWTLTWEQLFYEFNVFLKYITIIPPAILLIVTTHPSEFAASLNRIGVPYTIAYAVSLTLRYIPDIQRDYEAISQAQQARGLELSRKAPWIRRLRGTAPLLLPLIFSSLDRIDVISRAMELRGFGKYKKRTWYGSRPFRRTDAAVLTAAILLFAAGIWFTFRDGSRFYNPFMQPGRFM